MIDQGATTVWERWRGIDDDGLPHESLNHYSKGAVVSFLHRYVAGIRIGDQPAYRAFRIQPVPGGGLTHAAAVLESPYGRIESSWTVDRGLLCLDVTVPPGTCRNRWTRSARVRRWCAASSAAGPRPVPRSVRVPR